MNTTYAIIFDRFEKMITDYDLNDLIPSNKSEVEVGLLKDAIISYFSCPVNLQDRDDEALTFNIELSELEQKVLASYMVKSWIQPYLNNQDLFETNFTTIEYKMFSPANRIKALRDLSEYADSEASGIATKQSVLDVINMLR